MGTITVNNAAGVDYNAYIASLKALNGLTVAFTPIVNNSSPTAGDDTVTLSLGSGLSLVVYGEFEGTAVFNGSGPVFGFTVFKDGVPDVTAVWAAGHRFGLEDVAAALASGGTALETLLTTDPISFIGNNGADVMITGDANDTLNGGGGADTLTGGSGNDLYIDPILTGARADTIIELDGGGVDTVQSGRTISLATAAFVEKLVLTGGGNIGGAGNGLANTISGNGGNNKLEGFDGKDTLNGGEGDDTLVGGTGADRMVGGGSNDRYQVDHAGDQTVEAANGGIDTVYTLIDWTLAANIENLRLQGTANLGGTGNDAPNKIFGNSGVNLLQGLVGNDTLEGKDGADTLDGGAGNDTLTGGAHADVFRFSTANAGVDTITDFSKAGDRFDLGGGTFTALTFAANGDAVLTHTGGSIRIQHPPTLTLAQWKALILPSSSASHEPVMADAALTHDTVHIGHGDWLFS